MNFGQNLQFLRKMHNNMTQEELAEKMGVSRQTVSKWELGGNYPEIDKIIELCKYFSCSIDQLIQENMNLTNKAYSNIRVESFKYIKYEIISREPEDDAIKHVKDWAVSCNINEPEIIGWDFPYLSQEQINVYHMHGYVAACVLPVEFKAVDESVEIISQKSQKYAAMTIEDPFSAPFVLIPNAYKTLMSYMQVNNIIHNQHKEVLECFEKQYEKNGITYMDIYIAVVFYFHCH